MSTYFQDLTVEQQWEYIIEVQAEAAAGEMLFEENKVAARVIAVLRAYRNGPRTCAAQSPGVLECLAELTNIDGWYQRQRLLWQTSWFAPSMDELGDRLAEIARIALYLGIWKKEQPSSTSPQQTEEEKITLGMVERHKGIMDFTNDLRQAMKELPLKRDFTHWTDEWTACTQEARAAIRLNGAAVQRRANEILGEARGNVQEDQPRSGVVLSPVPFQQGSPRAQQQQQQQPHSETSISEEEARKYTERVHALENQPRSGTVPSPVPSTQASATAQQQQQQQQPNKFSQGRGSEAEEHSTEVEDKVYVFMEQGRVGELQEQVEGPHATQTGSASVPPRVKEEEHGVESEEHQQQQQPPASPPLPQLPAPPPPQEPWPLPGDSGERCLEHGRQGAFGGGCGDDDMDNGVARLVPRSPAWWWGYKERSSDEGGGEPDGSVSKRAGIATRWSCSSTFMGWGCEPAGRRRLAQLRRARVREK